MKIDMGTVALAAALALAAGCGRQDGGEKPAEAAPAVRAAEARPATAPATEKTRTTVQQTPRTAPAAASSFAVSAGDVLGDLDLPIEEIKQKAAGLDTAALLAYAGQYKEVLLGKTEQLAGMKDQLKDLSVLEMAGEKGKSLKNQLGEYAAQLGGLKERYGVYLDQLKAFGVDLSAYGL